MAGITRTRPPPSHTTRQLGSALTSGFYAAKAKSIGERKRRGRVCVAGGVRVCTPTPGGWVVLSWRGLYRGCRCYVLRWAGGGCCQRLCKLRLSCRQRKSAGQDRQVGRVGLEPTTQGL
jgi:hypothetical protein